MNAETMPRSPDVRTAPFWDIFSFFFFFFLSKLTIHHAGNAAKTVFSPPYLFLLHCQILRCPPLNCRFFLEKVQGICFPWVASGIHKSSHDKHECLNSVSTIYSTLQSNTPRIFKEGKKTLNTKSIFTINLTQSIPRGLPSITQPCHMSTPRISDLSMGIRYGTATKTEDPVPTLLGKTFQSNFFCIRFQSPGAFWKDLPFF